MQRRTAEWMLHAQHSYESLNRPQPLIRDVTRISIGKGDKSFKKNLRILQIRLLASNPNLLAGIEPQRPPVVNPLLSRGVNTLNVDVIRRNVCFASIAFLFARRT